MVQVNKENVIFSQRSYTYLYFPQQHVRVWVVPHPLQLVIFSLGSYLFLYHDGFSFYFTDDFFMFLSEP